MDFNGVNNRYGQVAVPDFLEHLCARAPNLSDIVKHKFLTQLQCSVCRWVSQRVCRDVSLKLYIPPDRKQFTLNELVDYNSNVVLTDSEAVFCGKCNLTPSYTSSVSTPQIF